MSLPCTSKVPTVDDRDTPSSDVRVHWTVVPLYLKGVLVNCRALSPFRVTSVRLRLSKGSTVVRRTVQPSYSFCQSLTLRGPHLTIRNLGCSSHLTNWSK